jgi:large subunit ribosomal protein L11
MSPLVLDQAAYYGNISHLHYNSRFFEDSPMAAKLDSTVKLQLPSGQATPAPPVGTALGPKGINIAQFVKEFNERTEKDRGLIVTVVIMIYSDRSFKFIIKSPPVGVLILKEIGVEKGSGEPNKKKIGKLTKAQVERIAKIKLPDTNARDLQAAMKSVIGSARSMGVEVEK